MGLAVVLLFICLLQSLAYGQKAKAKSAQKPSVVAKDPRSALSDNEVCIDPPPPKVGIDPAPPKVAIDPAPPLPPMKVSEPKKPRPPGPYKEPPKLSKNKQVAIDPAPPSSKVNIMHAPRSSNEAIDPAPFPKKGKGRQSSEEKDGGRDGKRRGGSNEMKHAGGKGGKSNGKKQRGKGGKEERKCVDPPLGPFPKGKLFPKGKP